MNRQVVLAGYPFVPIGVGEHLRASIRSCRAAGLSCQLLDVYDRRSYSHELIADPERESDIGQQLVDRPGDGINIFHINGGEVETVLAKIGASALDHGYNIIVPVWELSRYPESWARQLEKFDEIWAASRFVQDCIGSAVSTPICYMGQPAEPHPVSFLSRRYFHLPEGKYLFLFFFDIASFVQRKNPYATLAAFRRLLELRPLAKVNFVIKINNANYSGGGSEEYAKLKAFLAPFQERVHLIDRVLTDNEIQNLIRCCDSFLSLHRSEGFGRGMAEAMYFGKPVIATGYSGNQDFMTPETTLIVDYRLVPVAPDAYPFGEGQVWASADVEQAAWHMARLIDDPGWGRSLGRRASQHIRRHFSYLAVGLRYRARIEAILAQNADIEEETISPR
jgi:glycosyltransferase involved in cell wall biosynthesis